MYRLTCNSRIIFNAPGVSFNATPIEKAIGVLTRDMKSVLNETDNDGIEVRLNISDCQPECYCVQAHDNSLTIEAADTLGFVYGIYVISRELLGVLDFWFWNDQPFVKRDFVEVPKDFLITSEPFPIQLRGWFINDEVLLAAWPVERSFTKTWEMVFEALLRCGGNMIIPGTGQMSERNRELASRMGLAITHHHAEPLGAKMFARAYPNLNPSYDEHPDLFEKLWTEGIEAQQGMNVIWNLGFRGQGDAPFWMNDPRYDTDETRGGLISRLIKKQYDMVKVKDSSAVCCTNLYGETMELYKQGFIKLPEDIILIWADNGYGKMVSRRQNNHNPRVPALPTTSEGRHGIYYHVSFYDLQAANHITMLTNSGEFVARELNDVFNRGVLDYWIINGSNIKPHVFYLSAVAEMWRTGKLEINEFRLKYVREYYGEERAVDIAECFKLYEDCAIVYGSNEDDHAAEQFLNHGARILMTQWIKDSASPTEAFEWAYNAPTLDRQMKWYGEKCSEAERFYASLVNRCRQLAFELSEHAKQLFEDSILLHAKIYAHCCKGAVMFTDAFAYYRSGDNRRAFYCAGKAAEEYDSANKTMRESEHGKWNGFYANECLTDVKQTAWALRGLMSWLRCVDDGPHYYHWQREFLYTEEDKRVMLLLNLENHLTDAEIFALMKEKWEELRI